jgi:hypothetical protein
MKLSGKTKNGLSVGILESVTANEKALIDNGGIRRKISVEPLTSYFAGRLQKDFNKGETVLGGLFTAVNRQINDSSLLDLHKAAYTGGIDFRHNWKERTWYIAGNAEFSNVRGDKEALLATQQSSARYYQRPDASYLSVDSSLTSMSGIGGTFKLGRSSNKKIQFETSVTLRSPGLEFNDIGYMRYTDLIHHGTWVAYYLREPFSIFRNFYLNTNYWMYWNFAGKLMSTYANMNFNSQFKNNWNINGNFTRINEYISNSALRGGPSMILPGGEEFNVNLSSDYSKKFFFFIGTYQGIGDVNAYRNHSYWTGITVKPMNALSVSLEPEYGIQHRQLQYVETIDNMGDTRFLFSELDQKTMTMTFRLNVTINPELSLEYYGQPFVAAGKYLNFKSIINPHAGKFEDRFHVFPDNAIILDVVDNQYAVDEEADGTVDYYFDRPDFNFRQFRSNLVIRWEYNPGSALFLVWSQGRTSNASEGAFSYGNDMKELFDVKPHNIFLVKFSYWFAL